LKFGVFIVGEVEQQFFCQTLCWLLFAWRKKFGEIKLLKQTSLSLHKRIDSPSNVFAEIKLLS